LDDRFARKEHIPNPRRAQWDVGQARDVWGTPAAGFPAGARDHQYHAGQKPGSPECLPHSARKNYLPEKSPLRNRLSFRS
jgi:hypothetical protein